MCKIVARRTRSLVKALEIRKKGSCCRYIRFETRASLRSPRKETDILKLSVLCRKYVRNHLWNIFWNFPLYSYDILSKIINVRNNSFFR